MQFIHQKGRHHWISCQITDQEVYIYDSLQPKLSSDQLCTETKELLHNMYGTDLKEYITTDVTQQTGTVDCGLFAIANLTAICHGERPENFRFHQKQMRQHLLSCPENQELLPFPGSKKRK